MARTKNTKQKTDNGANVGFEAQLWQAADKLRGVMDASEYKHVALGLIFLLDHVAQEMIVGEVLLGGQLEIFIPVGQQAFEAKILQPLSQFFIHGQSLQWGEAPGEDPGKRTGRALRSARLPDRFHVG